MRIIHQYHKIMFIPYDLLETIEKAGRTCYKSEDKITTDSAGRFVKMLINRGHHAMIEFGNIIVKFVTNRGVTHELVRHRMCSFAQESTRYVNYGDSKHIQFIIPVWSDVKAGIYSDDIFAYNNSDNLFLKSCREAELTYQALIKNKWRPEQAREVLPNSLKTEIVVSANVREWRHIFHLRCSNKAHPQMQALMNPLKNNLKELIPVVFDSI